MTRAGATIFDVPADRAWLTAAEAADLALPGFAISERHIQRLLVDGELPSRKRAGRGGGREFHWTDLPDEARAEYLKRFGAGLDAAAAAAPASRETSKDVRADARAAIVSAAQAFIGARNLSIGKGLAKFSVAYAAKTLPLDPFVYGIEPTAVSHQVRTWERAMRNGGPAALLDKRGRPSGTRDIDGDDDLRLYIVGQLIARAHLSCPALRDAIAADKGREIPLRTLQAWVSAWKAKHAATFKIMADPDRGRSHHKPAFGSLSADVVRLNQRWELDATRADAMCRWPDGTLARPAITQLVDIRSRRIMVLVSDNPSAAATCALIRRAILAWGLPETIKADNGKEFVNRQVKQFFHETRIALHLSRAFSPEQKGHVERAFGTLLRDFFETLPGYVGHDVAQRQAIEHRRSFAHRFGEEAELAGRGALTPEQLQARLDEWIASVYEQRVHSALGTAPALMAEAHHDEVRRLDNERALDALLMPLADGGGMRVVLKKGLSIRGRWFIAAELGAHMGARVQVRLDPADLSRVVVYSAERDEFLCIAEDADAIGNPRRMAIAKGAQKAHGAQLRLIRNQVRAVNREYPAEGLADRVLAHAAGGDSFILAEESRRAMTAAERPQLTVHISALDALDAHGKPEQPIEPTDEQREGARVVLAEIAPQSVPSQIDDDLAFWRFTETELAAGRPLSDVHAAERDKLARDDTFQLLLDIDQRRKGMAG